MTTAPDQLLLPVPDEDGAPFWEYAARGELRVQACTACGRIALPAPPLLPALPVLRQRVAADVGPRPDLVVRPPASAAAARLRRPGPVQRDPRGARRGPADPAGREPRLLCRRPLDSVDPARLRIGARVQVVFTGTGGMTVPRWILEKP